MALPKRRNDELIETPGNAGGFSVLFVTVLCILALAYALGTLAIEVALELGAMTPTPPVVAILPGRAAP